MKFTPKIGLEVDDLASETIGNHERTSRFNLKSSSAFTGCRELAKIPINRARIGIINSEARAVLRLNERLFEFMKDGIYSFLLLHRCEPKNRELRP